MSLVPTMIVVPWPGARAAATERGGRCRSSPADERAEHRRRARALLPTPRLGGRISFAAPRSEAAGPATGIAIAGGNTAEVRGARPRVPAPKPVASGCEAKGLEKEFCDRRVDMSALQPANPNDISASAATCGTRREQSNTTIRGMVTHSYATNYVLSKHAASKQPLNPAKTLHSGQSRGCRAAAAGCAASPSAALAAMTAGPTIRGRCQAAPARTGRPPAPCDRTRRRS